MINRKALYANYFLTGLFLFQLNACKGNDPAQEAIASIVLPDSVLKQVGIDTGLYRKKINQLANNDKTGRWPATSAVPAEGAIVPYKRVVAFYGNFYSANMGILGEYTTPVLLEKIKAQTSLWKEADSLTEVIPAIHYIAVTAQGSAGDGYYRLRMPEKEIMKAIALGDSIHGLVFLDVQPGLSSLQQELPRLEKYLQKSNVHLGIDAEYSMKTGKVPGSSIGSFDAADINFATEWLRSIIQKYKLPAKMLVVHRFTSPMLTNYRKINTCPEVQIIINMDGFGNTALKKSSYYHFIFKQPVQFTGFKVFYKNDAANGSKIMQPKEILQLKPQPVYIQYQ